MVCMLCFSCLLGLEFTFLCMVMIYDHEFETNESKILTKVISETHHTCGLYSTLCSHLIQFEEAGFPKHVQNFLYRIKNDNNIKFVFPAATVECITVHLHS